MGGIMSSRQRNLLELRSRKLESLILSLRGERVVLDADLAAVYGVSTKRLNEQVKWNRSRFPDDFCFRLTRNEWDSVDTSMRSRIATAFRRNIRFPPLAFTEHGAIMAARESWISSIRRRSLSQRKNESDSLSSETNTHWLPRERCTCTPSRYRREIKNGGENAFSVPSRFHSVPY